MEEFIRIAVSDPLIIVYEIVGIVLFVILNVIYGKRVKKIKNEKEKREKNSAEEALKKSLANDRR